VIQCCFVVLRGEFATDIQRARLLKINDLQNSNFPNCLPLRASNQGVGGSTTSPTAKLSARRATSKGETANSFRTHSPREGWERGIRKSLGMSMLAFAHRMSFKVAASVNELRGAFSLETLKRGCSTRRGICVRNNPPQESW
jgi:hypothetical protein